MSDVEFKTVLNYLSKWRTKKQLMVKFNLSYTRVFNLLSWGCNGGFIKMREVDLEECNKLNIKKRGQMRIYKKV